MRFVLEFVVAIVAFYLGMWRGKSIAQAAYNEAAKLAGAAKEKL